MSSDPVVEGLDLSRRLISSVQAYIQAQILNSFLDKIPGVDIIGRNIESQLSQSAQAIYAAEQAIKTQIEPAITNAIPNAIQLAASLAKSLDDHLSQLLGNIATTEDVLGAAVATLRAHAPQLSKWIYNEVTGGFGATFLNVLKEIETQDTEGIDAILSHLLTAKHLPPYMHELLTGFKNRNAEWQALAIPALAVGAILGAVAAVSEPVYQALRQDAYSLTPVKELDPPDILANMIRGGIHEADFYRRMANQGYGAEVAGLMLATRHQLLEPELATRAYLRGIIPQQDWESQLIAQGFNTEQARTIWLASHQLLGEDYIRSAYLRGMYDSAKHDAALRQYGFSEETAETMRSLYFYIPPVADLIHMGIRNVFNPEIVHRFTLDGDYPADFERAARQQGISSEWAHKYWQAHWIMPGREAFFEMFQRTTNEPIDPNADKITLSDGTTVYNIMGRETLNLALRDIDTPPFYRDKLTQVAYRPLTRIDIRRLHKTGILTHAGVERAYLDLGYNLEHARMLADFTEKLNATTTKDQAHTLVANLQRHVIQLYIQDKLSEDQVRPTLIDLGFTDEEITLFLEEAKMVRAAEYSTAIESGVGKLYTTGRIADTDAIQRLRDAGVPDDAIVTLMDKWALAIEYRELPAHVVMHRDLTVNEVLEALVDGTIDEPTAEGMLMHAGYDKDGADVRIGLALFKAQRTARKVQIDAIKASYINGVIEQAEASQRLDTLYTPTDQRDAYLAEWSLSRETRTERIPIATLRDMFKGRYLDEATTIQHLKRHRYTDDDAMLLVKFWSDQPAPKGLKNVSGTGS